MKKFITLTIAVASVAYYAALPFLVAQAGGNPGIGPTGSTTNTPFYMRVTAYASEVDETDSTPFITANGTHVHDGVAASNILPFGTEIQIPALFGDKIFTIEDRMSQRIKNTIDIWMPSRAQAIVFGANRADIVIVQTPTSSTALAEAN
jgi:3D (Asp-Asp-Asp) domain-containing protein